MKKNYSTNEELYQILIEFKSVLNLDEACEKEYDLFIENLNLTSQCSPKSERIDVPKTLSDIGISLKAINEIVKIIYEFIKSNTS